jgi:predicted pPIWI-associating nuclease
MNGNDSLRKHAFDLIDNTERQRRFLQGLGSFQVDFPSQLAKQLAIASEAVAAFQMNPGFKAFLADIEQISVANAGFSKELARTLAPLHGGIAEIQANFASQLELHRRAIQDMKFAVDRSWFIDMESLTTRMAEMSRINFAIPEIALLHWPAKALLDRTQVLEDCVFNTAALGTFHAAAIPTDAIVRTDRLALATDFVFEHAEVVRRLPPRLPTTESSNGEGQGHRNEEIGAKLEAALRSIDLRLFELRKKAWLNVDGSVAGARLGMAGIRELFDEVLRIVAPDCNVEAMPAWQNRTDQDIKKPTRQIRLAYVLGEERAAEADAMMQFDKSIKRTQKFVHTFADDIELVRAQMTHLEVWIHLLLHYGIQRSRSNPS